eukprot:1764454-Rhodomonas_salina.1
MEIHYKLRHWASSVPARSTSSVPASSVPRYGSSGGSGGTQYGSMSAGPRPPPRLSTSSQYQLSVPAQCKLSTSSVPALGTSAVPAEYQLSTSSAPAWYQLSICSVSKAWLVSAEAPTQEQEQAGGARRTSRPLTAAMSLWKAGVAKRSERSCASVAPAEAEAASGSEAALLASVCVPSSSAHRRPLRPRRPR